MVPLGRFTEPSEPTLPIGLLPAEALSGCQSCVQPELVQMNLPACSPLRRYSVSPRAFTRTVPRLETEPVFTSALEEPLLLCEEAGWLGVAALLLAW